MMIQMIIEGIGLKIFLARHKINISFSKDLDIVYDYIEVAPREKCKYTDSIFCIRPIYPGIRFKFTGPNPICSDPRPRKLLTGEVSRSHVKVSIVYSILQSINNRGLVGYCLLVVLKQQTNEFNATKIFNEYSKQSE